MIIDFYSEILKDKDLKEMVYDIRESSTRLIEIVNDFLDLSRLEQGRMNFKTEPFAIDKTIESVIYEMHAVLQQKNLYLKYEHKTLGMLPLVWADQDKTKQVIYNLVGNASKFTEQGGIEIKVEIVSGFIKVLIIDTGRGIPPESQVILFHKFQQASNSLITRDTTKGTGLGLYISKMLVEHMGGKVVLEHSEIGKGTTFSFTLPLATTQQQSAPASSQANNQQVDTKTGIPKDSSA